MVITKEAEVPGRRLALRAEGLLDSSVQVFDFAAWLPETELALFRVELPEKVEETGEKSKLERKASKMSRRKSLGTGVKFGQRLLLRHIHSSRLLSLTHEHAANSPGAFQVLLSSPRTEIIADIALQPINKLQKLGEPVRYRDKLQVLFLFGGIRYNMHCAKLENGFEVHGSHRVTTWTFEKYDKFEVNPESLRTEMPFLIQLQRFSLHITPKRKDRNEIHPQSDATDIEDKADAFLVTDRDDYAAWVWVLTRPGMARAPSPSMMKSASHRWSFLALVPISAMIPFSSMRISAALPSTTMFVISRERFF